MKGGGGLTKLFRKSKVQVFCYHHRFVLNLLFHFSYIQWGSEIRPSLDFVWSKRSWLLMVRISNGIWNPEAQPFEIWTNGSHFVKPFEIQTKMSEFRMIGTVVIAMAKARTFLKLDHLKSDLQKVWISNVSRFQMVKFQIPTVYRPLHNIWV